MTAEKKSARRVGAERDSFPEIGIPTGSGLAGGTPDDPARAAERAFLEKQRTRQAARETANAALSAADLMRGAGFDPADLDRVAATPEAVRSRPRHQEATQRFRTRAAMGVVMTGNSARILAR